MVVSTCDQASNFDSGGAPSGNEPGNANRVDRRADVARDASVVWRLVAFDQRLAVHTRGEIFFVVNWDAGVKSSALPVLFLRWRKHNIPVSYMSIFTALQVDRTGQALVAVKGATGDAGNFLVIDDGVPILHHRYRAAH